MIETMLATAERCAHCGEAWYGRSVPTATPLGTMHRSCSELYGRWVIPLSPGRQGRMKWQAWKRRR